MSANNISMLSLIYHVEVTDREYGVTNENVDYTSFNISHFVKSRYIQRVVGELTIYDNGTAVYKQNLISNATKADVNAVSSFVLMVAKSNDLSLRVW